MAGINGLDIKQLRVLHYLLIEKNASRVASRLGLTQQAVSEQLKKLRLSFRDPLFNRKSNGLVPTAHALSLQQEVAEIITRLENITKPKVFEPSSANGVFRICASDYAQAVVLPSLIQTIREQAPNLKIIVQDFEIDNLSVLMDNGEFDIVISFPKFVPSKYPTMTLFTETHTCVIAENHKRANEKWTVEQIAKHPQLVISPKRANLVGSADAYFEERGLKRNIVMSVPFFSAAAQCIVSTDIIAFLPTKLLPINGLKELDCGLELPSFEIIVAWHKRMTADPLHNWIRDIISRQPV